MMWNSRYGIMSDSGAGMTGSYGRSMMGSSGAAMMGGSGDGGMMRGSGPSRPCTRSPSAG